MYPISLTLMDIVQICVIALGAGITIGVVKGDLKFIKARLVQLENFEKKLKLYVEKSLSDMFQKFEDRIKFLEQKVKEHDQTLYPDSFIKRKANRISQEVHDKLSKDN